MRCFRTAIAFAMLCAAQLPAWGQTGIVGRVGPVYGIGEQDFAQFMRSVANDLQKSGAFARGQEKVRKQMWKAFNDPDPIAGIEPAREYRVRYVDPGIVVDHDIEFNGRVIVKAGTYANALDKINLDHGFLFLDARDPRQKEIGREIVGHYGKRHVHVILVGGGPAVLQKEWNTDVYYDQGGYLTRKLKITVTPVFVSQDQSNRRLLRVDELPVN